jgi:hypothetical protein
MDVFDWTNRASPNQFTSGRGGNPVLLLVCHNTAGPRDNNAAGQPAEVGRQLSDFAARWLTFASGTPSAHYLVGAESIGAPLYKLIREGDTAYHAGGQPGTPSRWVNPDGGQTYRGFGVNQVSIGIELLGNTTERVGPRQQATLQWLVEDLARRYPVFKQSGHIVAHGDIDTSRTDGRNWLQAAIGWATGGTPGRNPMGGGGRDDIEIVDINYRARIPRGIATVRTGPGRGYPVVRSVSADPMRIYNVQGEAHGDLIGNDDVWSRVPELGGFITRTALQVLH